MSEEEARSKAIAILLMLATDFGLGEWLDCLDQEASGKMKEAVIRIVKADMPTGKMTFEWEEGEDS